MSARRSPVLRASLTGLAVVLTLAVAPLLRATGTPPIALAAASTNAPVTPGNFEGYGFDQCTAPSQAAMDKWLNHSPYLAVGIYISGNSRGCRSQPNLTPSWVQTQLTKGWKLLPITMGPQASCNPRYPRYNDDPKIIANKGAKQNYAAARRQGQAEAQKTVQAAGALGIVKGSTLWYDLESFDIGNTACRESALAFLSAYDRQLHLLGYVSGVYSSAGSGIVMLDDARRTRPNAFVLPDRIWIARWDNEANTSTTYISNAGWTPGGRVKQYEGGHNETYSGVTIDVDKDFLDLGRGNYATPQRPCGGISLDFTTYPDLTPQTATKQHPALVKAVQCMLHARGDYSGPVDGRYTQATVAGMHKWKAAHGFTTADNGVIGPRTWAAFLSAGKTQVLKTGSTGLAVYRLQRAYNAVFPLRKLPVTGIYNSATRAVTVTYQKKMHQAATGIAGSATWQKLRRGTI